MAASRAAASRTGTPCAALPPGVDWTALLPPGVDWTALLPPGVGWPALLPPGVGWIARVGEMPLVADALLLEAVGVAVGRVALLALLELVVVVVLLEVVLLGAFGMSGNSAPSEFTFAYSGSSPSGRKGVLISRPFSLADPITSTFRFKSIIHYKRDKLLL